MLARHLSAGRPPPRLRFRGPNLHLPLRILALGWAAWQLLRILWWLALHPRTTLALAGVVLAWGVVLVHGWAPFGWTGSMVAVVLGVWWARWPDSFRRQVLLRGLSRWRWLAVYRRDWQPAMVTAGLAHTPALGSSLPRLRRVVSTAEYDTLRVRMIDGQTVDDWRAAAPKLATTFRVRSVRVGRDPRRVRDVLLTCRRRTRTPGQGLEVSAVTKPPADTDASPVVSSPGAFPRQPRRPS